MEEGVEVKPDLNINDHQQVLLEPSISAPIYPALVTSRSCCSAGAGLVPREQCWLGSSRARAASRGWLGRCA